MRAATRILSIVLVVLATYSCIAPQNSVMERVDMRSWSRVKSLAYINIDTLSQRDLNIAIRYNDNFENNILPLRMTIMTPDSMLFEDTVMLQLLHPATALSVSTTESRPYRTDVVLDRKGAYIFAFKPLTEVRGVEAIGIELK